ncbi:MAG: deoxyuridine 5'-triphosphate nucleotidohydrolase [Thermomicrobiales bacterium]
MTTRNGQGVLSREAIDQLLDGSPPLLDGMPDRSAQVQPNGIDISVETVSRFRGAGTLGRTNATRVLPETEDLAFDDSGSLYLPAGSYQVRFNETVNLPAWLMAYLRPRSSLLRSGVALHTAVWDAGYSGRGVSLMVVYHPAGFHIEKDARVGQLVFHPLVSETGSGYAGAYQHEGSTTQ